MNGITVSVKGALKYTFVTVGKVGGAVFCISDKPSVRGYIIAFLNKTRRPVDLFDIVKVNIFRKLEAERFARRIETEGRNDVGQLLGRGNKIITVRVKGEVGIVFTAPTHNILIGFSFLSKCRTDKQTKEQTDGKKDTNQFFHSAFPFEMFR